MTATLTNNLKCTWQEKIYPIKEVITITSDDYTQGERHIAFTAELTCGKKSATAYGAIDIRKYKDCYRRTKVYRYFINGKKEPQDKAYDRMCLAVLEGLRFRYEMQFCDSSEAEIKASPISLLENLFDF